MDETKQKRRLRRILPVIVLLIGAGAFAVLLKTRRPPKRRPQTKKGVLVDVMTVAKENRHAEIVSQGTVQPRKEAEISSQVAGRIVWVHPQLVTGGFIKNGDTLLKIDPVDYRLALERANVALATAQKSLTETESNAAVARREWKIIGEKQGREANPLALYKPQLKLAQANLRGAEAEVEQAKVNLSRTVLRAPFNLRVRQESVERGQYVMAGRTVATVFGTDEAEVIVPLPVAELTWLNVPDIRNMETSKRLAKGAQPAQHDLTPPVRIEMHVGDKVYAREGTLVRTTGETDSNARMTSVVVRIEDPYDIHAQHTEDHTPPFQVGTFVHVRMRGRQLTGIVPIPAFALRLGSIVWTADQQNKLRKHKVTVARLTEKEALISSGISEGDHVILTTINDVIDGMRLRIRTNTPAQNALRAERAR